MAVTGNLTYLQFGGRNFATEEWSCGLYLHTPAGVPGGGPINIAATYAPPIQTWVTSTGARLNSFAKLDYVKANDIDPVTGRYADPTGSNTYVVANPPNGSSTNYFPPQCSLALSFYTNVARGPASQGRMYPPQGFQTIGTDGRVPAVEASAAAAAAATLIVALNAVDGPGEARCVVFSKTFQSVREILGVRVGRVVDTQRRRRTNLPEEYVVDPLA